MTTELTIPFGFAEMRLLQELVRVALGASSLADHDIFSVALAFEEAMVNAVKHGTTIKPALEIVADAINRDNQRS